MRKLFLVAVVGVVCLMATRLDAQVEKGDVELDFSGSLGWGEASVDGFPDQQSGGLDISAGASYFLTPHVDIGGEIGAGYARYDDGDAHLLSLGPGFRYHFRPESTVVPFAGSAFGVIQDKRDVGTGEITEEGWFADASGGADFFLNDFVSIKLTLRYRHVDLDLESKTTSGETDISAEIDDVTTFVGFSFFFRKKDHDAP
jgi:hypothetical protein